MKNIELGLITKTQGLKGEFRVKMESKFLKYVKEIGAVTILGNCYTVKRIVDRGGFFVFSLAELSNINQIEGFINKPIFASINFEESSVVDLVGFSVMADGKDVGEVAKVNNYGASDVITLTNEKMFAVSPNLVLNIDKQKKQLIVDKKILDEVII